MPQFIKHRINTIKELATIDPSWGVEIDLRSIVGKQGALHLSHETWEQGEDFLAWLSAFKERKIQGPIILNTKEDGMEGPIIDILAREKIDNYFFLDTAIPTLVQWTAVTGNKKFAVRLSTYEGVENVTRFEGLAEWVWIDCFGGTPLDAGMVKRLKGRFKLCLVSPELQRKPLETIKNFKPLADICDAICTKRPDLWA